MDRTQPVQERPGVKHRAETVLAYIIRFKRQNDGLSPTMREMCDNCGIPSLSHLDIILNKLDMAGWIRRDGKRGIRVVGGSWSYAQPTCAGQEPACARPAAPKHYRAAGEGE